IDTSFALKAAGEDVFDLNVGAALKSRHKNASGRLVIVIKASRAQPARPFPPLTWRDPLDLGIMTVQEDRDYVGREGQKDSGEEISARNRRQGCADAL